MPSKKFSRCAAHGFKTYKDLIDYIEAYDQMVSDRIAENWEASLITFMFNPTSKYAMTNSIEHFYERLITRVVKRPKSVNAVLPMMIVVADLPVHKRQQRMSNLQALPNDGLHHHGVVLIPPKNNLGKPLKQHVSENKRLYLNDRNISSLDIAPVTTSTTARMTDYVMKTFKRGKVDYDDAVIVLPRSRTEPTHRDGIEPIWSPPFKCRSNSIRRPSMRLPKEHGRRARKTSKGRQ